MHLYDSSLRWAIKKTLRYTENTYILKPLLDIVTAAIEAIIILENKFLFDCLKEVYRLWVHPRLDAYFCWNAPILTSSSGR
jgi:hypothetical protein